MSRIDDLIAEHCPNGVPFVALGELGRRNKGTAITAGKMKALASADGPIRVFAGGNTIADVAEDAVPASSVVREPSIIVKSRGHVGFAFYDRPFTHKSELWSYTISDPNVDLRFVYHFLLTKADELQDLARATSVKLPQLSVRDTDMLKIPLPPIVLQREIASVLDKMEALKAELAAELAARASQYAYYRDALLSFSVETSETPPLSQLQDVRWTTLGEVGTFTRGRRITKADFVEVGFGCIHYGEIYTHYGTAASVTRSFVRPDLAPSLRTAQPGDLVIAATGENTEDLGRAVAWIGDHEVAVHDDCYVFSHTLNPKFASYLFQSSGFARQKARFAAGAKVVRISGANLAKIRVPVLPPAVQDQVVEVLDKFDALVNDISIGLPAEIAARQKQYEYYRDKLLSFEELAA